MGPKLTDAADWAPLLSQLKTKKKKLVSLPSGCARLYLDALKIS